MTGVVHVTYVPYPHLPSWSDMTKWSIERKKGRDQIVLEEIPVVEDTINIEQLHVF